MAKVGRTSPGPGGRPSRAEARLREARLVETAAALFMERGFDATSVDAVAEAAGVSKATVYSHYQDKADLFAAVLRRQINELFGDLDQLNVDSGGAEEVLLNLGRRAVMLSMRSEATAIYRTVIAQAHRFPVLAEMLDREGFQRGSANIANVLRRLEARGELTLDDPDTAAEMFLSLVIGRQSRMAMLGLKLDPQKLEDGLPAAVHLFLRGVGNHSQDRSCLTER
jgi:TetR/AcrR family transcriptional repressor of mexJK operon